jgi:thymidylate kinase
VRYGWAVKSLELALARPTLDEATVRLRAAGLLAPDESRATGTGDRSGRDDSAGPADATASAGLRIVGAPWGAVRRTLAGAGFADVGPVAGRTGHRFAAYDPGLDRWLRLDLTPLSPEATSRESARPRTGLTVAILGPDGAGKTTLTEAIAGSFSLPVRRLYAGLYPADRRRFRLPGLETLAVLARQLRLTIEAARQRRRGALVLFDRFAYDARLPLPPGAGRRSRLRRALIARSSSTPDLVVVLDAPAEVLVSRREEHSREVIEAQRTRYAELAGTVRDGVIVDARPEADAVRRAVTALIWSRVVERGRTDDD